VDEKQMKTSMPHIRKDGRTPDQLRPVSISYNVYDFASGSVLFEMGKTKILCAVSLQNGVPPFLRGKGTGWLTAEYALLPMSTMTRTQRESNQGKKDGRSVEIARFIGRCFRSVIDVSGIGEKTITIDCDVLQADGGTRTASITGAFLALAKAQERWLSQRIITKPLIKEKISALSVGVVDGIMMKIRLLWQILTLLLPSLIKLLKYKVVPKLLLYHGKCLMKYVQQPVKEHSNFLRSMKKTTIKLLLQQQSGFPYLV